MYVVETYSPLTVNDRHFRAVIHLFQREMYRRGKILKESVSLIKPH